MHVLNIIERSLRTYTKMIVGKRRVSLAVNAILLSLAALTAAFSALGFCCHF